MLPDPPPGWSALQQRARQAKSAKELAALIDEMNLLLTECEKAARDADGLRKAAGQAPGLARKARKKTAGKRKG